MKRVLVYGTFDLFHYGHLELLKKTKELYKDVFLIVGVNSDEYVKLVICSIVGYSLADRRYTDAVSLA